MRIVALTCLTLITACDSPSSSSSCADNPSLPACQADTSVATDVGADATSDVSADATTERPDIDAADPPECVDGLERCDQNLVEECIGGRFVATTQCMGNDVCINGACVTQECVGNQERCVDDAHERCVDNRWELVEACTNGCDETACSEFGDDTCADLMWCVDDERCELAPGECVQGCAATGTEDAQDQLDTMMRCYDDQAGEGLLAECVPLHVRCMFPEHANGSCHDLYDCNNGCASRDCITDCYGAASVQSQERYLQWVMCMQLFCGGTSCGQCNAYEVDCIFEGG